MRKGDEKIKELIKIMQSLKFRGKLIFAKIAGSHSHNTNVPESDLDALGVYQADTDEVLGIDSPKDTICNSSNDFTIHELSKFCRLLLKGNPGIIEMLFTEKMCFETGEWRELRDNRKRFLSQRVIKQYLGYLNAQMHKLNHGTYLHTTSGKYNTKFAYHFIRLGKEALNISEGKDPVVWVDGADRDLLLTIREGVYTEFAVKGMAHRLIRKVESNKPWPLPEEGDKEWLNDWLLKVRKGEK